MSSVTYLPLNRKLFSQVIELIDRESGTGFYSRDELEHYFFLSTVDEVCTSFVAVQNNKVIGLRLTLALESWQSEYSGKIDKNLWPAPYKNIAYFFLLETW